MALKTSNYTVAESGVELPVAYALVIGIDTNGKAILGIGSSRENVLKGVIVKRVTIDCKFNRNGDLMTQAYESATQPKMVTITDDDGVEKEVKSLPYFHNWQDDIV